MRFFILALLSFSFPSLPLMSQSRFEGIIQYQISNTDNNKENVPRRSVYYLKDNNLMLRVFTETGDELARILLIGNERSLFMIDDVQKSAMKLKFQNESEGQPGVIPEQYKEAYEKAIKDQDDKKQFLQPKMEDTGESEMIAGYSCIKYRLVYEEPQKQSNMFIWMTEGIHFDLPETWLPGENPLFQFLGVSGFPLKLRISSVEGLMEMVATKVERKRLKDELFTIPYDYTISDLSSFILGK
jgi:hypothetical protein